MITFPMSKGNTISPVAELTIRMLVMDPKKKDNVSVVVSCSAGGGKFFLKEFHLSCLANRFYVFGRLVSNRSQMTSKFDEKKKSGDVIYAPILRKIISKNQSNCVFCSAYHIIQDIGAVTMVTAVVPVTSM